MISAWHLLWIVPLSGGLGMFIAAILPGADKHGYCMESGGLRILRPTVERQECQVAEGSSPGICIVADPLLQGAGNRIRR